MRFLIGLGIVALGIVVTAVLNGLRQRYLPGDNLGIILLLLSYWGGLFLAAIGMFCQSRPSAAPALFLGGAAFYQFVIPLQGTDWSTPSFVLGFIVLGGLLYLHTQCPKYGS